MNNYIIVTTLCDSKDIANKIVDTLLEKRLVAACQVIKSDSSWIWKGVREDALEYLIQMRTKKAFFSKIEEEVRKLHNYETFELSYYEIYGASKDFLDWLDVTLEEDIKDL